MENKEKEIIKDIKRIAELKGLKLGDKFGRDEYLTHPDAKFSSYDVYDGGKSFEYYRSKAGYSSKAKKEVSDEKYYNNYKKACLAEGREPKKSEYKKYGLNITKSRRSILIDFKRRAISEGILPESNIVKETVPIQIFSEKPQQKGIDLTRLIPPIPEKTKRKKWERTGIIGFPYAPRDESGVIALLSILCSQGLMPWQIIDLNSGKGIDAICYDDENHCEFRAEIKHTLSKTGWNHSFDSFDYLVCWENRWKDFLKPVIELKTLTKK